MEYHDKYFTKEELEEKFKILEENKTFGQIDSKNVFHNQRPAKGILGCVIEQSVLGMKQNSLQEADLEIMQSNGEYKATELKVTGVQPSNKTDCKYEAKEPMSLTAVSIGTIESENFLSSHFYNKIAHMLWVFYVYSRKEGQKVVPYSEYERFPVLGYVFLDIADDESELNKFKNDWLLTQRYLIEANTSDDPEKLYPLLHRSIKDKLFYIDIAPRYSASPRRTPRFRLKKSYVDFIFQEYFSVRKNGKKQFEKISMDIDCFEDLETKLKELTNTYKNKTIKELLEHFKILYAIVRNRQKIVPKHVAETIAVNMMGGKCKKISNIELFGKIGVIGKSIVITKRNKRTEDIKLFTLNVDELSDQNLEFENSSFYQYFSEHKILCIIYEEPNIEASLLENKFLGFKWFTFDDEFINTTIREVYDNIRDRIINHTLEENYLYNKNGIMRINKTGVPMVGLNFPKSSQYDIFVRGTSNDSTYKPWTFEGKAADGSNVIHSYTQQIWIKGSFLVESLKKIKWI